MCWLAQDLIGQLSAFNVCPWKGDIEIVIFERTHWLVKRNRSVIHRIHRKADGSKGLRFGDCVAYRVAEAVRPKIVGFRGVGQVRRCSTQRSMRWRLPEGIGQGVTIQIAIVQREVYMAVFVDGNILVVGPRRVVHRCDRDRDDRRRRGQLAITHHKCETVQSIELRIWGVADFFPIHADLAVCWLAQDLIGQLSAFRVCPWKGDIEIVIFNRWNILWVGYRRSIYSGYLNSYWFWSWGTRRICDSVRKAVLTTEICIGCIG